MPEKKKQTKQSIKYFLPYLALVILLAYALVYSIANVGGPSFYGDDTTYLGLANDVLMHNFQESSYIFSIRLLQIYPIAFFYALLGVNQLSSSLWDIFSFVLTAAVVFFIGKEVYNSLVGILSSFLYCIFPLVVRLSATISDDIPMAFLTSLAVLALVMAEKHNSRKWYFLSGAFALASPIVTPEGAIIIVFIAIFLIVELARKRIKLKDGLFAVYGFVIAGLILMLVNYLLTNPRNPLITLSLSNRFYSAVGKKNTIPSTNTNPWFYINTLFPYNIVQTFISGSRSGNIANALSFLNPNAFVPNSRVGFFMYAFVIALAYLLIKRERRVYIPAFWFFACFLYLEFGPMHVSLSPFNYLLSYRLGRFLTIIAPPTVLVIGMAAVRSFEKGSKIKRPIGVAISIIGIAFLVYTSVLINNFWHETLISQTYDQIAIGKYLSTLPNNTKIYFSGFASLVPIYMHFDNLSRFYAYDSITNCTNIPAGAYVILPYFTLFDLNYTSNPSKYCPDWQLILAPTPKYLPKQFAALSEQLAEPFAARLYFVPYGMQTTTTSTTTTNTTKSSTTSAIASNSSSLHFNFFNLTGVGVYNATIKKLTKFITVNNVSAINITVNKTAATPGDYVMLNVTFIGHFLWSNGTPEAIDAARTYLAEPVINIHYYGIELANESSQLLVQNNGPWQKYVNQIGEPHQVLTQNTTKYLRVVWIITPNATMLGNTLKLCGGYFATYQNTTLNGGWGSLYNKLAYEQLRVVNASAINIPSESCAYLKVD